MDGPGPELSWSLTGPPTGAVAASMLTAARTYCSSCGIGAQPNDSFCSACGYELRLFNLAAAPGPTVVDLVVGERSAEMLKRAHYLLVTGEVHEAVPLLEELVGAMPEWPGLRAYLGVAYVRVARVIEAQLAIEAALEQSPEDFTCRMAYGEYFARLGFYDKAVHELDRALAAGTPGAEPYKAAFELRRYCNEKTKGMFYRQTALPRWPKALQRWRTAKAAPSAAALYKE